MTHIPVWSREKNQKFWSHSVERIFFDPALGLLSVEHDGSVTWDELQRVKDHYFGKEACAIEVYPPHTAVVNSVNMRHLWKLGPDDFWPDLGREGQHEPRTLRERYFSEVHQSANARPSQCEGAGREALPARKEQ